MNGLALFSRKKKQSCEAAIVWNNTKLQRILASLINNIACGLDTVALNVIIKAFDGGG
ncbi:hypothetical protein GYH30_035378 [Glycine max]|nr:hypothetical protein GYH30_035378 [Glycine max]